MMVQGTEGEAIPVGYKAWVFGSKLVGVLVFAVGIEMMARGALVWAGLLLLSGAVIVLVPVSSPDAWERRFGRGR